MSKRSQKSKGNTPQASPIETGTPTEVATPSKNVPAISNLSAWFSWIALLAILGIQVFVCYQHIHTHHFNGNLHFCYSSAEFLHYAVHSNDSQIPDIRKFFGTALYHFDESNRPKDVTFYANHGLLLPTLTRMTVSLLGPFDSSVRVICLLFSLGCTTLLFSLLRIYLKDSLLVVGLSLLYVMLPLKYSFVDAWKYESSAEFFMLACLLSLSLANQHRIARYSYWLAMGLTFHSDYPAFLMVGLILAYLATTIQQENHRALLIEGAIAGLVGLVTTVALQGWLGFFDHVVDKLVERTSGNLTNVSWFDLIQSQWIGLVDNLGILTVATLGIGLVYSMFRPKLRQDRLWLMGMAFLSVNIGWCVVFRNHVYIHSFTQWFFLPGTILVLGAALNDLSNLIATQKFSFGRVASYVLLLILIPAASLQSSRIREYLVTKPDQESVLRMIASIDDKLLVTPQSGPRNYWTNRALEVYTDPIYRKSTKVGVQLLGDDSQIQPNMGVFPVINSQEALTDFVQFLQAHTKPGTLDPDDLVIVQRSPSLLFVRWAPGQRRDSQHPAD